MAISKITKSPTPTELVKKVNELADIIDNIANLPLGTRIESISKLPPAGTIRADDGSEWTEAIFPDFFQWLLTDGQALTCTYAEWTDKYKAQNCNVAEIAVDKESKKFKMPSIKAGTFVANKGDAVVTYQEAGLPNIDGVVSDIRFNGFKNYATSGAFNVTWTGSQYNTAVHQENSGIGSILFNASESNSIYNKSNTVTPENIRYYYYMVVANVVIAASDAQMSQITGSMAAKANVDFSNCTIPVVIESWSNNSKTGGYRKWSSGELEQWGQFISTTNDTLQTVDFYIDFAYIPCVFASFNYSSNGNAQYQYFSPRSVSKKSFQIMDSISPGYQKTDWHSKGYWK